MRGKFCTASFFDCDLKSVLFYLSLEEKGNYFLDAMSFMSPFLVTGVSFFNFKGGDIFFLKFF